MNRLHEYDVRQRIKTFFEPFAGIDAWSKIGVIHTRGKYAPGDTSKVIVLENEFRNSDYPNMETKGIFIMPYDYGLAGEVNANVGSTIRSYWHQVTWIVEFNDDRRDDAFLPDDPAGELMSSFDFFCDRIDAFLEILDLKMGLGYEEDPDAPPIYHTLLRTQEPIYDLIVEEMGIYHFAKFSLETRVMVPIALC